MDTQKTKKWKKIAAGTLIGMSLFLKQPLFAEECISNTDVNMINAEIGKKIGNEYQRIIPSNVFKMNEVKEGDCGCWTAGAPTIFSNGTTALLQIENNTYKFKFPGDYVVARYFREYVSPYLLDNIKSIFSKPQKIYYVVVFSKNQLEMLAIVNPDSNESKIIRGAICHNINIPYVPVSDVNMNPRIKVILDNDRLDKGILKIDINNYIDGKAIYSLDNISFYVFEIKDGKIIIKVGNKDKLKKDMSLVLH